MRKSFLYAGTLGFLGMLGSSAMAQVPNVGTFSLWVTEIRDGTTDAVKCSQGLGNCPTQNVPLGLAMPGDKFRIDAYIGGWDAQPARGFCDGDPAQGHNALCTNIGTACTGMHCQGQENTIGSSCINANSCGGIPCIQNVCRAFPRLATYTASISGASLASGASGQLVLQQIPCDPGDCAFLPDQSCPCAQFLPSSGQCTCAVNNSCSVSGFCTNPSSTAFIEKARPDWLFFGKATITDLALLTFFGDYEFSSVLFSPTADATTDTGIRRNLGTILVQATPTASGTFTVQFLKDSNLTFVNDANAAALDGGYVYQDLIINFPVSTAQCSQIVAADPVNCDVDGRQPHDIGNTVPAQGITSIDLVLSAPCSANTLTPADFSLSVNPPGGTPPTITGVGGSGNNATLTLSGPILPDKWTCIMRTGGNQVCVGFLPGDVNANLVANTADVTAAISSLNGMVPEPLLATDTNRSTVHTAEDLVRILDIFNGGGAYGPSLNKTLPNCPTGP